MDLFALNLIQVSQNVKRRFLRVILTVAIAMQCEFFGLFVCLFCNTGMCVCVCVSVCAILCSVHMCSCSSLLHIAVHGVL